MSGFKLPKLAAVAVVAAGLFAANAHAAFINNFAEVGNDVVAVGSGSANITGLTFFVNSSSQVVLEASSGNFLAGTPGINFQFTGTNVFSPVTGFGPGNMVNNFPTISVGDYFGLSAFNGRLFVLANYISGSPLNNSATWTNRTFTSLGLTQGTYVYTFNTGANADTLTINIPSAVPEPASLSLVVGWGRS